MIVKVIGKQHMEGVSKKTNNEYNFNIIHCIGKDPAVIGFSAMNVMLDSKEYPFDSIFVDCEYNLEYGPRNRIVGFTRVVKPSDSAK